MSRSNIKIIEQFYRSSYLPNDPVSFVLFLLILMSYRNHSTDKGIELMMVFFNQVLILTGKTYRFPKKISTFVAWAELSERLYSGIKKYVLCEECHSLYPYQTEDEVNNVIGKKCSFKDTLETSVRCGNSLFKKQGNNLIQVPKKMFFYNSIGSTLKKFLKRETFVKQIENRKPAIENFASDIQHGSTFQSFKLHASDEVPFVLQSCYNLLITINIDWFNLCSNAGGSTYTLGGVYATIQNLSRDQRNKTNNSILVAILPGKKEATMSQINR